METGLDAVLPAKSGSVEETRELGRQISALLRPGDIVALYGNLGAGKTEMVRGICAGLGVDELDVNSPTFTILNEYRSGSRPIYHFDAYRLRSIDEFFDLGYEDYFFDEGISIIEWADKVEVLLPPNALHIQIDHVGADKRVIRVRTKD